ncbi:MAG TPA: hypothetical protein PJ994_11420, partial [Tepidiformaceae bacterium]|nr:hypothetical protein [Tepidiformaceae bacterium]
MHSPWAQAIEARLVDRSGFDVQTIWSDDGNALRFASGEEPPSVEELFPSPDEVEELVVNRLANTAMFAARFRENAGRALLLPRRRPGARSPLWLQRQRSASLLAVPSRYGSFPIVLETYRECLRDVFDMPGLIEILQRVRSRAIRIVPVETREASPFARSLLFDYVAAYMYEGDAPLAERRAQALTLDRNLLKDLLGEAELRELLDAAAIDELELELQCLAEGRKARNADQLHDLLRRLGDLDAFELAARVTEPRSLDAWLADLEASRRACKVRIGGEERWIPAEDAGRFRDAIGVAIPLGVPEAFLKPTSDPLEGILARYARTHGPFVASAPAARWAIPEHIVRQCLQELEAAGSILHGDFRPGGTEREWCDPDVLRGIKRRSLARLRKDVEPVDGATFARFLHAWHGIGANLRGPDRLRDAIAQLEGLPIAASALERDVLPARVSGFAPAMLDDLCAGGEIAWFGAGRVGRDDGKVVLVGRDALHLFAPKSEPAPDSPIHAAILEALRTRGALFFSDLVVAANAPMADVLEALWDLVWQGFVTNDTFAPVRALSWPRRNTGPSSRGRIGRLPPESAGRWSLVQAGIFPAETSRLHRLATSLLERQGVVTREGVSAEDIAGGFSSVYPVLKAMEDAGRIRRGYFVEGLGAAQFASPAAVERLRAHRHLPDEPATAILAATDPAQPFGAAIPWPRREGDDRRGPARSAGTQVVLVNGEPVLVVERG